MRPDLLSQLALRGGAILALLGVGQSTWDGQTKRGAFPRPTNSTWRRPQIACGRPYIVEGQAIVAPLVDTVEWRGDLRVPNVLRLSRAEREVLGQWWANVGLLEHASVAAFARFSLQLLQLGAPPEFLDLSQRAMADEILHAKLAFTLAGAYLGKAVGPGLLPMGNTVEATTLRDVLRLVVREGCIGETVAALGARHALSHCQVPEVGAVLERVANDENAHSDLAWRFVRWALDVEPALVDVLLAECTAAVDELAVSPEDSSAGPDWSALPQEKTWLDHGAIPPRESAELRRLAIERVVLPCARAFVEARVSVQPSWY